MDTQTNTPLVNSALEEQKMLNLPWYTKMSGLYNSLNQSHKPTGSANNIQNSSSVLDFSDKNIKSHELRQKSQILFEKLWKEEVLSQSKLKFYALVKQSFTFENYLDDKMSARRSAVAKFRSSSHRFNVETGRYHNNKINNKCLPSTDPSINNTFQKRCLICCCGTDEDMLLMTELPGSDIIIEDELHVLRCCPLYEVFRPCLPDNLKIAIWNNDLIAYIFNDVNYMDMAEFIYNISNTRFPKKTG